MAIAEEPEPSKADPPKTERTRTARGDKAQRHRDVLSASSAILEESGWEGFSIREIAARTEVSPGAIYQWFSGKSEIWAHLQRARFLADAAAVAHWEKHDPDELIRAAIDLIARNHVDLGRYRFDFVDSLEGEIPDYALELAKAHRELRAAMSKQLAEIIESPECDDLAARLSWLWAVGKGIGDHMIDDRYEAHGVSAEEFLETAAHCALAGFTAA